MHQYFVDKDINVGEKYFFNDAQSHHIKNVLRMKENEIIRLVYNGQAYFSHVGYENKDVYAQVYELDNNYNELKNDITLAIALIKRDKLELVLQKATELGVNKIVLFKSSRCVIQKKEDRLEKQFERMNRIILEASEQCKRNIVPNLEGIIDIKDLDSYKSEVNLIAYEDERNSSKFITSLYKGDKSCTIVIGPEGGFSQEEVKYLNDIGYLSIGLGTRILRAETAVMYSLSVLGEIIESSNI